MLTACDVCERLQISRATLERMVRRGDFPEPVKLGPRLVRWRPADLDRFLVGDLDQDDPTLVRSAE